MYHTKRSNRKILVLVTLLALFFPIICSAQDDLLKLLETETPVTKEKVIATFKGDKVINVQTNETVRKKNLDVRISHLFGNVGVQSGGGIHNFYGIDQSADTRIGFHYGLTDRLMFGVSRAKRNENFEGLVKFRALEQETNGGFPFALTLFGNTTYSIQYLEGTLKDVYRLTYCTQMIFARKFSPDFSLLIIPVFVHRNFVEADDENNTYSLCTGLRYKFTRSTSLIFDYSHTFGRKNVSVDYYDVLGVGIEVETGGHVFSVMFTNASGILENDYLVNTQDSWTKGGMKFSFNISRMFRFGGAEALNKELKK
jgi:hypothetical protein